MHGPKGRSHIDCINTPEQGTVNKEMSYDEDGFLWVKLNSIEEASTENPWPSPFCRWIWLVK